MSDRRVIRRLVVAAVSAIALGAAGCSSAPASRPLTPSQRLAARAEGRGPVVRLGLADGITDAPGLVAVQKGYFQQDLGVRVMLQPVPFTSSAAEGTALSAGRLDAAYLDPVTAVRLWQASRGRMVRVVAGAASGGAELVVATKVIGLRSLAGMTVAAPAGSAQDAAMRTWLRQHSVQASVAAGNVGADGTSAVKAFRRGHMAGGWELAPFDAQMTAEGGHVLLNEASLWPGGKYSTDVLVVTVEFLSAHPAMVGALLKGNVQGNDLLSTERTAAQAAAATELTDLFGQNFPPQLLAASFTQVTYTDDPLAATMLTEAQHAAAVGQLKPLRSLTGLFDLRLLNKLLHAAGQLPVPG